MRIDLGRGTADNLISDEELAERRKALEAVGGYKYPESQTPWQEIQRAVIGQMETGAVLENAVKYQDIAHTRAGFREITIEAGDADGCWKKPFAAVADWGTTRFRLWTLDADGAVLGRAVATMACCTQRKPVLSRRLNGIWRGLVRPTTCRSSSAAWPVHALAGSKHPI